MRKKLWRLFPGILSVIMLTACGRAEETATEENTEPQKVELVVWGAEEDAELMNQIIQSFQAEYQGQADFQISFEVQGESQCKDVLLGGLEDGADVFTFAAARAFSWSSAKVNTSAPSSRPPISASLHWDSPCTSNVI